MTNERFLDKFKSMFVMNYGKVKTANHFANFNWKNIAIMGGFVIDLLFERPPKDIDFFLYGLDADQTLERAKELLTYFLNVEKKHYKEKGQHRHMNIKARRDGNVITLKLSAIAMPIQIVLATVPSKYVLATSPDIAVTGVLFDGTDVLITEKAKWEFENMTIEISSNCKSFPAQARMKKYFEKGFDIIFSDLDVAKLPRRFLKMGLVEAIQSPSFIFSYSKITENRINLDRFLEIINDEEPLTPARGKYLSVGAHDMFDSKSAMYENIEALAREDKVFTIMGENDFILDVLELLPNIGERQIDSSYLGISDMIFNGKIFNLEMYQRYVKAVPMQKALRVIGEEKPRENFKAVIEQQRSACKMFLQKLKHEVSGLKLSIVPLEEAFTVITDKKEFYGDYVNSQ